MTIQWTTITWYSRLAAIIFFVGILPVLNFYIGVKYQETTTALQQSVEAQDSAFSCPIPAKILKEVEPTSTASTSTTTPK
jgi:hypothetical protein